MKQREKSARQQGHPCLMFVHDIASAVIPNFPSIVTFTINCMFLNSLIYVFRKNLNASKPSEHPPQVEECLKV